MSLGGKICVLLNCNRGSEEYEKHFNYTLRAEHHKHTIHTLIRASFSLSRV